MSGTRYLARLGDRSLFPKLAARAYLNHAAIAAPSIAVTAAARAVLEDYEKRGMEALGRWVAQRATLKEKLGALIGADADELALVPSTSHGVMDVALCFPWTQGDEVVVFEGEFPANVTSWQRAAELYGLEVKLLSLKPFARHHDEGIEALNEALSPRTRLVAVSAVQFSTGLAMPLRAMADACHARGAELFVDGIQALGVVPIDVRAMGIDYLAGGAHKWLMGLEGIGFLYASHARAKALRPNVAGWLSHEEPIRFLTEGRGHLRYDRPIRDRIDFVEGGSTNAIGCAALEASVDLIQQIGVEDIYAHVSAYNDLLEGGLEDRGFRSLRSPDHAARSGSLSVLPPEDVDVVALHRALVTRGVSCSIPDGRLRFSPHFPNHVDEVDVVLGAIEESLGALRD